MYQRDSGRKSNDGRRQMISVSKRTVQRRIKNGMTRQEAESTPNTRINKISKEKLLELSTLGLSRRGAASILVVSSTLVNKKIIEFGIEWVGKPVHNAKGQRDPNAICNKCELLGLNKSQVYDIKKRYKVTLDDALEIAYSKKLKKVIGV